MRIRTLEPEATVPREPEIGLAGSLSRLASVTAVAGDVDFERQLRAPAAQAPLRILFLSHYFPPEVNAPASRTYEMCKRWVRDGHEVTVVTCAPNCPTGILFPGYRNKLYQSETIDGINVVRVWTFLAANKGKRRRAVNFLSYMVMATFFCLFRRKPDMMIATSPQFFCGLAGMMLRKIRRFPFILEVRDIWPESIKAVGALKRKWGALRILESLEYRMYRSARQIVTVGDGYRDQLINRGVEPEKISVVTNGVDQELFVPCDRDNRLRHRFGINGEFVCAYIGTIGMAAGLEVVLDAAHILKRKGRNDVKLMLVGDGANRQTLETTAKAQGLQNVIFTGRLNKSEIPRLLGSVDSCLVHLKRQPLFESVLPSKIFEAAGMQKPIILGVRGCAADVVRKAGAGICIEPENAEDLVAAIEKLAGDEPLRRRMGKSGYQYVCRNYDREKLSREYVRVIRQAVEHSI